MHCLYCNRIILIYLIQIYERACRIRDFNFVQRIRQFEHKMSRHFNLVIRACHSNICVSSMLIERFCSHHANISIQTYRALIMRACQLDITCSKHVDQHIVFLICHVDNFHWNYLNQSENVSSTNHCDNVAILKYLQSFVFSVLVIFVKNN